MKWRRFLSGRYSFYWTFLWRWIFWYWSGLFFDFWLCVLIDWDIWFLLLIFRCTSDRWLFGFHLVYMFWTYTLFALWIWYLINRTYLTCHWFVLKNIVNLICLTFFYTTFSWNYAQSLTFLTNFGCLQSYNKISIGNFVESDRCLQVEENLSVNKRLNFKFLRIHINLRQSKKNIKTTWQIGM